MLPSAAKARIILTHNTRAAHTLPTARTLPAFLHLAAPALSIFSLQQHSGQGLVRYADIHCVGNRIFSLLFAALRIYHFDTAHFDSLFASCFSRAIFSTLCRGTVSPLAPLNVQGRHLFGNEALQDAAEAGQFRAGLIPLSV